MARAWLSFRCFLDRGAVEDWSVGLFLDLGGSLEVPGCGSLSLFGRSSQWSPPPPIGMIRISTFDEMHMLIDFSLGLVIASARSLIHSFTDLKSSFLDSWIASIREHLGEVSSVRMSFSTSS